LRLGPTRRTAPGNPAGTPLLYMEADESFRFRP